MAMEKEALTHKIEDDLAARNRNWDEIDSHLASSEAHGLNSRLPLIVHRDRLEGGTSNRYSLISGRLYLIVCGYKVNPTKYLGMIGGDSAGLGLLEIYKGSAASVTVDGFDIVVNAQYTTLVSIFQVS